MTGNAQDNILRARAGNDVLYGHSGTDFLNGELGQDQMFGGIGNDTVIVDDAGDYVWEAEGEGMDTVQSYISYALQDDFEILILIGQTGVVANGNALANLIQGNDADNVIDGRGGQDSLWGLGGNDALTIHSGQEDVSGGMGVDTLRVAAELGMLDLAGRAGQTFTGLEAIDLTNSSATTLRLTMGSLLAISTESDSLQIDGDAGDVLQIESGWVKSATATAGYDQYTRTEGADSGSLRVTEGMAVAMGVWV
jgi:Ca2+-binding RTX toxin-like protein